MTAVIEPAVHKGRGPLVAILVANVLSVCGTTMTYLAVPWFVLETTGSPVRTGLVLGVEIAGTVAAAVLAGPVIDRLGRKRSSVHSDLLAALAVAAVPVLYATVGLPFWALLGLTTALGVSRAPGQTARSAMLPRFIEAAGTTPHRAMGAYEGANRTAKALGAPLAGVLIAVTGAPSLLLVDGATFVVSAGLVWIFVPDEASDRGPAGTYVRQLLTGFDYLRRDRLMGAIVLMVTFTNALDIATLVVLFPVYARDVLHSSVALGLMSGLFAAGAVVGNTLYGWIGHRLSNWATYTVSFMIAGVPRYFLAAAEPGLPWILVSWVLIGVFCGAVNPVLGVVQIRRLPGELRAKVLGLISGGVNAVAPLGAVLGGVAVAVFGLTPTLLLVGVLYLLATLCPLVFPAWRQMDAD
jgi:MFS family permease